MSFYSVATKSGRPVLSGY